MATAPEPLVHVVEPTSVEDSFWVYAPLPGRQFGTTSNEEELGYGKWLVFRSFCDLDATWAQVCAAIASGELNASAGRCSTKRYNPSSTGGGPRTSGVICVYSTRETVEEVGGQLIQLAQHDISYKTVEATKSGKYTHRGEKKVTEKTILWNEGSPLVDPPPDSDVKRFSWKAATAGDKMVDRWHLNTAAPIIYGHWTVFCKEEDNLTELWHKLKQKVEFGELAGVVKLECPLKPKDKKSKSSVVFVHTVENQEIRDIIGKQLSRVVQSDVLYSCKERKNNYKMLWNEGKPHSSMEKQRYKQQDRQQARGSDNLDWRSPEQAPTQSGVQADSGAATKGEVKTLDISDD